PRTYLVTDEAYHDSNVLVAQMTDGTVLIASSPFETVNATALMNWINKKFVPTKTVAINTHFHADGTGGNEAYASAGVEIWASEETRALHMEKGEAMRIDSAESFKD